MGGGVLQVHMKAKGKSPQMAKRALAYKWQRIIFRCWQDRVPYDEATYIERLKKTNSPLYEVAQSLNKKQQQTV